MPVSLELLPYRVTKQLHHVRLDNNVGVKEFSHHLSNEFTLQAFQSFRVITLNHNYKIKELCKDEEYAPIDMKTDKFLAELAEKAAFPRGRAAFKQEIGVSDHVKIVGPVCLLFPDTSKDIKRVSQPGTYTDLVLTARSTLTSI